MNRRTFMSSSTLLGLSAVMGQEITLPEYQNTAKIPVKILATNWGFTGSWDVFCAKAKADGYDGFEAWIPFEEKERDELLNAAAKHKLEIGFLAGAWTSGFSEHLETYTKGVELAVAAKPLYVNTHAGRDYFTFDQNLQILKTGIAIGQKNKVPVLCETHRSRCAFSANATQLYMDALPDLRLTADLSHWCVVHESLLEGYEKTVAQALSRTLHVHARVGHSEGPQVNDPRAPEWNTAVKTHFGWWDAVMKQAETEKRPFQTFLCEFGPPHYLPALPYTQQPVTDQWAVNVYMMRLLRERYT